MIGSSSSANEISGSDFCCQTFGNEQQEESHVEDYKNEYTTYKY